MQVVQVIETSKADAPSTLQKRKKSFKAVYMHVCMYTCKHLYIYMPVCMHTWKNDYVIYRCLLIEQSATSSLTFYCYFSRKIDFGICEHLSDELSIIFSPSVSSTIPHRFRHVPKHGLVRGH